MKKPKAFVYTELQLSVQFAQLPWQEIGERIQAQPGFLSKTWLSGDKNNSIGGFYGFDSLENARRFACDFFPAEVGRIGVPYTTRVFDGTETEEASRALHSPYYS